MNARSDQSRPRMFAGVAAAMLVLALAAPALADAGGGSSASSSAPSAAPADVGDGHDHEHDAAGSTQDSNIVKHGDSAIIVGALTGDSPCELSGPPASEGQVGADAEGHDVRGPVVQKPITQAEREQLIIEQRAARSVIDKYPTVASAEADGYHKSTPYVPCIGAHYTKVSLVPRFDPAAPSELLFDGTAPESKIVGLSYLVLNPGGAPEGFAGPNDVWHQHNTNGGLCLAGGLVVGNEKTTDAECTARGGKKVVLTDIWMVHDWVAPGWECGWGIFAGECPELGGRLGGTAFDEPDPKAFAKASGDLSDSKSASG